MSILTKIITAPFKVVGWGVKKGKDAIFPAGDDVPIEAVKKLPTEANLQAMKDYYQITGNDVTTFGGYAIVWKKNTSDKSKSKTLEELKTLGI